MMTDAELDELQEHLQWLGLRPVAMDVPAIVVVRELRAIIDAEPEGSERRKVLDLIAHLARSGLTISRS